VDQETVPALTRPMHRFEFPGFDIRISFGFPSDFDIRIWDLGFRIWLRLRHPAYVRAGHGVSPFWA
jgi:hypothetical protein